MEGPSQDTGLAAPESGLSGYEWVVHSPETMCGEGFVSEVESTHSYPLNPLGPPPCVRKFPAGWTAAAALPHVGPSDSGCGDVERAATPSRT